MVKKQYMSVKINELQISKYFIDLFELLIPRKILNLGRGKDSGKIKKH